MSDKPTGGRRFEQNPEGKIFIGGLNFESTVESLHQYFGSFGEIIDAVVMKDPGAKINRGFGFVTFKDSTSVDTILEQGSITIDGRAVDVKRAVPKSESNRKIVTKKIFLGGLPNETKESDIREAFSEYEAHITEVIMSMIQRGFGFIVFDDENMVDQVVAQRHYTILGKSVEVKKAEPKPSQQPQHQPQGRWGGGGPHQHGGPNYRNNNMYNGGYNSRRNDYGGGYSNQYNGSRMMPPYLKPNHQRPRQHPYHNGGASNMVGSMPYGDQRMRGGGNMFNDDFRNPNVGGPLGYGIGGGHGNVMNAQMSADGRFGNNYSDRGAHVQQQHYQGRPPMMNEYHNMYSGGLGEGHLNDGQVQHNMPHLQDYNNSRQSYAHQVNSMYGSRPSLDQFNAAAPNTTTNVNTNTSATAATSVPTTANVNTSAINSSSGPVPIGAARHSQGQGMDNDMYGGYYGSYDGIRSSRSNADPTAGGVGASAGVGIGAGGDTSLNGRTQPNTINASTQNY